MLLTLLFLCPAQRALDRPLPALYEAAALILLHATLKRPGHLPVLSDLFLVLPVTHGKTRQIGSSQRGGLDTVRTDNGGIQ